MKEKIKKHLEKKGIKNADAAIEENLKYFEYLEQPAKIADAISRVI